MAAYDPVPPYDLEDIEGQPDSNQNQQEAGPQDEVQVLTDPHRRREGKLTERECCEYAFRYFFLAVVGVVFTTIMVTFLATRNKCDCKNGH